MVQLPPLFDSLMEILRVSFYILHRVVCPDLEIGKSLGTNSDRGSATRVDAVYERFERMAGKRCA